VNDAGYIGWRAYQARYRDFVKAFSKVRVDLPVLHQSNGIDFDPS
jgi:hypothetical protein